MIMVPKKLFPGHRVSLVRITIECRKGKGADSAFTEAVKRTLEVYNKTLKYPANDLATMNLILTVETPEEGGG